MLQSSVRKTSLGAKTKTKSNTLLKIAVFLIQLSMSSFVFVAIHEEFHYLMANWLHLSGYVTFNSLLGGTFWFTNISSVSLSQNVLVSLSGGLGTALVTGVLWSIAKIQNNDQWAAIFCTLTILQFIYGISEMTAVWIPMASQWGQLVAAVAGYTTAALIYGNRILDWFFRPVQEKNTQADSLPDSN